MRAMNGNAPVSESARLIDLAEQLADRASHAATAAVRRAFRQQRSRAIRAAADAARREAQRWTW